MKVNIGGDRIGSGNKEAVSMRNYERSSHDLSYVWRSTMAAGTLIPCINEIGLPGDSFEINLDAYAITLPTIGPLYGSYKLQVDVYVIPTRLYVPKLQSNQVGIGNDMARAKLPQVRIKADGLRKGQVIDNIDNLQINPSSIFHYLGIKGVGTNTDTTQQLFRDFNATSWLAYWEIYKDYYSNKQEEIGAIIHNNLVENDVAISEVRIMGTFGFYTVPQTPNWQPPFASISWDNTQIMRFYFTNYVEFNPDSVLIYLDGQIRRAMDVWTTWQYNESEGWGQFVNQQIVPDEEIQVLEVGGWNFTNQSNALENSVPKVETFPLKNIDDMRENLMQNVASETNFVIEQGGHPMPYGSILNSVDLGEGQHQYSVQSTQEGLGLKTYQSDVFNNWMSTEWIDGANGINEITAVDVSEGKLIINELSMANKIYNMLNRIALGGGTYDDWLKATYTHERNADANSAIYVGGLSKELIFEEVISTAENQEEGKPLGTLAGKGRLSNGKKGGRIKVKTNEPSIIMGLVSLTPRIDYSQGNKWTTGLKSYDDFHKPALDGIGFQDLITDKMAWWDTGINPAQGQIEYNSAGKQNAWIDYTTNVNELHGNFAEETSQMFMVLARRYEPEWNEDGTRARIKDLTTYIEPTKFNHIFADTRIDAQNFMMQIGVDITARRKMAARSIPNL